MLGCSRARTPSQVSRFFTALNASARAYAKHPGLLFSFDSFFSMQALNQPALAANFITPDGTATFGVMTTVRVDPPPTRCKACGRVKLVV